MKESFDYADGQGYFDHGGGTGGGLGYDDTVSAVQIGLENAIPSLSGSFTGIPPGYSNYTKDVGGKTFETSYGDFVDTVKDSQFYSIGSAFFGSVPSSGGQAPVILVDGGNTFGQHSFDFSRFSTFLAIIKTCVVLAFCFISVRFLIVNK